MDNLELCWNITAACNQACKYCHRFLYPKNLTYELNQKILNKLNKAGIDEITWTGGEALMFENIDQLIKSSYEMGIKNKIITNGMLLDEERAKKLMPLLSKISFSIDSLSQDINELLGRGKNHGDTFKKVVKLCKEFGAHLQFAINSVATKINAHHLYELGREIEQLKVSEWRIFQFMPLRDIAKINKDLFLISDEEFRENIKKLRETFPDINIVTRNISDFEKKYVLILANGDIVVTKEGKDVIIGNALEENFKFSF